MSSFLSSLVPSFDFSRKSDQQDKEKTNYTRGADVEGWVFLAEDNAEKKTLTYADIAAGRKQDKASIAPCVNDKRPL